MLSDGSPAVAFNKDLVSPRVSTMPLLIVRVLARVFGEIPQKTIPNVAIRIGTIEASVPMLSSKRNLTEPIKGLIAEVIDSTSVDMLLGTEVRGN